MIRFLVAFSLWQPSSFPHPVCHNSPSSRILMGPARPMFIRACWPPCFAAIGLTPRSGIIRHHERTQQMLRYVFQTQNKLTLPIRRDRLGWDGNLAWLTSSSRAIRCWSASRRLRAANDRCGPAQRVAQSRKNRSPVGQVFSADEIDAAREKIQAEGHRASSHGRNLHRCLAAHGKTLAKSLKTMVRCC